MWGQFVIDTSHTKIRTCILSQHVYSTDARTQHTRTRINVCNTHIRARTHAHTYTHTRTRTRARTRTQAHNTHVHAHSTQDTHIYYTSHGPTRSLRKESCSVEKEADGRARAAL